MNWFRHLGISSGGRESNVSTPSGDRQAMDRDLDLISDIRAGAPAVRARSVRYLPRYEMESLTEYNRRVAAAPWRPEFVDCLNTLTSKPFGRDVRLADGTPESLLALAEDIDGRGNNLTRFARHAFCEAIAYGFHGILVDYPIVPMPRNRALSVAEERAYGAKPFWINIPLRNIVSLRTEIKGGREIVSHLRTYECVTEPDGYGEKTIERIRLIEPRKWQLWERDEKTGEWFILTEGATTFDEVPLCMFFTGQRLGTLQVEPPLRSLAEMQVELFRAMSRQDEVLTYAGSPMLAAIGIARPENGEPRITVGPKSILFAPPSDTPYGARFEFISPNAAVLTEIRAQVASVMGDLRRLGMQPTTDRSGDITATATSVEAAKAHSALEAWALGLKDTLEQAFRFTARWMTIRHDTVVEVHTDFVADDQNVDEATVLLQAQKQNVLSAETTREELKRRNILGPQFEEAIEATRVPTKVTEAA